MRPYKIKNNYIKKEERAHINVVIQQPHHHQFDSINTIQQTKTFVKSKNNVRMIL